MVPANSLVDSLLASCNALPIGSTAALGFGVFTFFSGLGTVDEDSGFEELGAAVDALVGAPSAGGWLSISTTVLAAWVVPSSNPLGIGGEAGGDGGKPADDSGCAFVGGCPLKYCPHSLTTSVRVATPVAIRPRLAPAALGSELVGLGEGGGDSEGGEAGGVVASSRSLVALALYSLRSARSFSARAWT